MVPGIFTPMRAHKGSRRSAQPGDTLEGLETGWGESYSEKVKLKVLENGQEGTG